MGKSRGLMLKF